MNNAKPKQKNNVIEFKPFSKIHKNTAFTENYKNLSGAALKIVLFLKLNSTYAGKDEYWWSGSAIYQQLEISSNTFYRAVKELIALKILTKKTRYRYYNKQVGYKLIDA